MRKWLYILVFVILYGLVTFFGLGPVLLADGTFPERLMTLALVIGVYGVITYIFWLILKRHNK
ncbi:DUF6954 family protein [Ammoniphilus resinae]|uniref:Uncharacterized protein n=1 Tax=Ammoniphilus resinae TaxID=861532 RepID=A0ABS4GWQ4_9BACL|nr:hypothetical protein [Ammoniphilus resinae]MBP1934285.1 hypothetical protein [Ammoniphilus resinae]